MDVIVWMSDWQFDCCGEPFGIGSEVSWTLGPAGPDWLTELLPPEAGVTIDAVEDHHALIGEDTPPTRGTVVAIQGAYCRYEHRGRDDPARYPVGGSGVLLPLTRPKRFQEHRGDLVFLGYVIRLAVSGP